MPETLDKQIALVSLKALELDIERPSNGPSLPPKGTREGGQSFHFFAGDGEMGERISAFDWSRTAIGPIESWSPSLQMMVKFLLANRFPLLLWWGPRFIQIYNDAYRPILGAKHPSPGLGRPV